MAQKPANMAAAGLLASKGAAKAPADAPQRSAVVETAKAAPTPAETLVPLQFRVPTSFREEFEQYAFHSSPRRKMVDVLKDAFDALKEKERGR